MLLYIPLYGNLYCCISVSVCVKHFYVILTPIITTLKPDLIIEKWPENGLKDPLATYVHPCA